jgi:hypothetical protein
MWHDHPYQRQLFDEPFALNSAGDPQGVRLARWASARNGKTVIHFV